MFSTCVPVSHTTSASEHWSTSSLPPPSEGASQKISEPAGVTTCRSKSEGAVHASETRSEPEPTQVALKQTEPGSQASAGEQGSPTRFLPALGV